MLTPLSLPTHPNPVPPGTQSLPLPQGAEAHRTTAHPLLPMAAQIPPSAPAATAARSSPQGQATAPPSAQVAAQATPETLGKLIAKTGEALLATAAPAAQGSSATSMSLVAAQMLGTQTLPIEVLLAQQAATRALPGHPRRTEPRSDDPPAPALAAPEDSFDPHSPHPPPVAQGHHGAGPPPEAEAETGPPAVPPKEGSRAKPAIGPPKERPELMLPPFPFALPEAATPWVLAGIAFATVFLLTVLAF